MLTIDLMEEDGDAVLILSDASKKRIVQANLMMEQAVSLFIKARDEGFNGVIVLADDQILDEIAEEDKERKKAKRKIKKS